MLFVFMILKGKYNTDKVRIMPDCRTGAGCVIGFTADLREKSCEVNKEKRRKSSLELFSSSWS
jgi:hypothetical protein